MYTNALVPDGARASAVTVTKAYFLPRFCLWMVWDNFCLLIHYPCWLKRSPTQHAWISNHMLSKVYNGIMYPFPNFSSCIIEVWEWISNFSPHTLVGCNYSSMQKSSMCYCVQSTLVMSSVTDACPNRCVISRPNWLPDLPWWSDVAKSGDRHGIQ